MLGPFCDAVLSRLGHCIQTPDEQGFSELMAGYASYGMLGCVGAIDCTHIKVRKPGHLLFSDDYYCSRKSSHTLNVQAVCGTDLSFWNVLCARPGSMHDSRVLQESSLFDACEGGLLPGYSSWTAPDGALVWQCPGYLIGDSGYPLLPWLLTPFPGRGGQCGVQGLYNGFLTSARNPVERAFGLLKARWALLEGTIWHKLDLCVKLVMAAFLLHNWLLKKKDSVMDDVLEQLRHDKLDDAQAKAAKREMKRNARATLEALGRPAVSNEEANEASAVDFTSTPRQGVNAKLFRWHLAAEMSRHGDVLRRAKQGRFDAERRRFQRELQARAAALRATAT